MIIQVSKLEQGKTLSLCEDVTFDPTKYPLKAPLLGILSCQVKADVMSFDDFVEVMLHIEARVALQCSYTLERFEMPIHSNDELRFGEKPCEEDEELIVYRGSSIDLTPNIFNLLCASLPLSPKKPGAKPPVSGKDYRVLSDEDLKNEHDDGGDPRFDKLKDLDL